MTNTIGTDILIQAADPKAAARFYMEQLVFTSSTTSLPKPLPLSNQIRRPWKGKSGMSRVLDSFQAVESSAWMAGLMATIPVLFHPIRRVLPCA